MKKLLLVSAIVFGSVSIAAAQAAEVVTPASSAKAAKVTTPAKSAVNKANEIKPADAAAKQKEIAQSTPLTATGARPANTAGRDRVKVDAAKQKASAATVAPASNAPKVAPKKAKATN